MGAAAIAPALGLAGSLFGASSQNSAANQQAQAAQQATQASQQEAAEQANLQQQGLDLADYMKNIYQQDYSGLNPQLGGIYGQQLSETGSQIGPSDTNALAAASSPGYLDQASGTNALGMNQAAQQYLSNPGATLDGVNGTGGQAINYYENEAKNGLNAQYAGNALSQASAGDQQSINNVMNQLGSEANPNALIQNAQNQYLAQRTNLAGQFAGDSQQLSNQATSAAQSTASGIDSQTMQMLQAAAASGNSQAQQYLSNAMSGADLGQSILSNTQGAVGQAGQFIPGVSGQLLQTGAQYGAAASNSAGAAAQDGANASQIRQSSNPFTAAANVFASNPGMFNSQGSQPPANYGGTYDPNGGVTNDGAYGVY